MAMTSLAFDTHTAVKSLRKAGAGETLAEAVVTSIGAAIGQVATKGDINDLRKELEYLGKELEGFGKELEDLKQELEERPTRDDLKMLEQHLTIRLGGLLVGGIVVLATMMQVL